MSTQIAAAYLGSSVEVLLAQMILQFWYDHAEPVQQLLLEGFLQNRTLFDKAE